MQVNKILTSAEVLVAAKSMYYYLIYLLTKYRIDIDISISIFHRYYLYQNKKIDIGASLICMLTDRLDRKWPADCCFCQ